MEVSINGQSHSIVSGHTLADLLEYLNLAQPHLAVAINSEIVPRSELAKTRLHDGDQVELVQAVGGG